MNILLTGGCGYIGSHTAVVLSELGHKIVLFDNLSNSCSSIVDKLQKIVGKNFSFVRGDVRCRSLLEETFSAYDINAVLHFAGLKSVSESSNKPIDYYSSNVQGAVSLIEAMHACAIKILVFSSSATVYGDPNYLPLDEEHPMAAINPYGRTKLHVEEMLKDVASSSEDWRICCLRYFNPVGSHESGLIGDASTVVGGNLMPLISQVAIGKKNELSVFGSDYPTHDGTGVRDYIHVMDLAEGHLSALNFLTRNTGCHRINLGTGQGYSVLDLVRAYENVSGQKIPFRMEPRRLGDVAECYADPKKAMELFGWTAKRTLHDMCASAWNFQKSITL